MADITVTATAVVTVSGGTVDGTAGEAIDAGEWCYKKSDGKYYLADCDAVAVAADSQSDNVIGIAMCSAAAANQPVKLQTNGSVTMNSALTAGTVLYLSNNAGKMTATWLDIASTDWITTLGMPSSATVLDLDITRKSIQKP